MAALYTVIEALLIIYSRTWATHRRYVFRAWRKYEIICSTSNAGNNVLTSSGVEKVLTSTHYTELNTPKILVMLF